MKLSQKLCLFTCPCIQKDDALFEFPRDLDWSPIDQQQAASVEVAFAEEEAGRAIQHLSSNKLQDRMVLPQK